MQCNKCDIEVPSTFEFALAQNVCPKCGNKLMPDAAMRVYLDLKTRLHEVEFVMDKTTVCERVAMFLITNYDIVPLKAGAGTKPTISNKIPIVTAAETAASDALAVAKFKAELAAIAENMDDDMDTTAEEIRAEEAARAEELAVAREMGLDAEDFEDGDEMVSGRVDNERLQRLKKIAATNRISKTGSVGMITRSKSQ